MWTTLLGLIERWWREKPRLDLVRAIVQLRDSMQECQRCYRDFTAAKKSRTRAARDELPWIKMRWRQSIARLSYSVGDLDDVLSIFDTATHRAVFAYTSDEAELDEYEDSLLQLAAQLGQPLEIDVRNLNIEVGFDEALKSLDAFIRSMVKPEEIDAHSRSRLR